MYEEAGEPGDKPICPSGRPPYPLTQNHCRLRRSNSSRSGDKREHCPLRYLDTNCINVKDILGFPLELNIKILYLMKLNMVHLEMPRSKHLYFPYYSDCYHSNGINHFKNIYCTAMKVCFKTRNCYHETV